MLEARRVGLWRSRYELTSDDQPLATWAGSSWRTGGRLDLAGGRYDVRSNPWGTRFDMTDGLGTVVAVAKRVGRKRWAVEAGGRSYQFRRAAMWRSEEVLIADDRPVGFVRRVRWWRSDAVAELPGLPLPVQVFVMIVVLTMWDRQAAAAASASV
jgi:hypothetical protein